jgi:hypothetical protein
VKPARKRRDMSEEIKTQLTKLIGQENLDSVLGFYEDDDKTEEELVFKVTLSIM